MIIKVTISGVDQYIDTSVILYAFDNSGLEFVLNQRDDAYLVVSEIFENNAPNASSFPTYANFVSENVPGFLQVSHAVLTNICINLSRVLRLEAIDASNTTIKFDNMTYVEVDVALATLQTNINAAIPISHGGTTGLQGGVPGQYYHLTAAQHTVVSNTSGTNSGDNATNTQYSGLAASKQDTLVSGTNIKTVNGTTLLGSGDLAIGGITIIAKPGDTGTSSTSFTDVTDLKFPVVSGETYWFRFIICYTVSGTTLGTAWAINGPTLTNTIHRAEWSAATGHAIQDGLLAYDATTANTGSITKNSNMAVIEGIITCGASGDVIARMLGSSGTGALTAKAFSTVQYKKIS